MLHPAVPFWQARFAFPTSSVPMKVDAGCYLGGRGRLVLCNRLQTHPRQLIGIDRLALWPNIGGSFDHQNLSLDNDKTSSLRKTTKKNTHMVVCPSCGVSATHSQQRR
jgi:hypothetical protein